MWHADFKINGLDFEIIQANEKTNRSQPSNAFLQLVVDLAAKLSDESALVQVQSSGSTGAPKTFTLDRQELIASADLTLDQFNLTPLSRVLLCLPISAISGVMMLVRAMRGGLDLYVTEPDSGPLAHFETKPEGFFDFVALTPYQLSHSLNHLNKAKTLLVGGAPLTKEQLSVIPENLNLTIVESYGMTETLSHVALRNRFPVEALYFSAVGPIKFSLGDAQNLIIHAPHLKRSPLITSDRVQLVSETQFSYLGRVDHAINSGGVKFFPEQIEQKIQHLLAENFFVAGCSHETLGQQITLFIEGDEPARANEVHQLLNQVHWKTYEKPKKVWMLKQFSYTSTHKIDRVKTLAQLDL